MDGVKRVVLFAALAFCLAGVSPAQTSDPRVEINNLRYHTHSNFTRLVLDIGKLREYISENRKVPARSSPTSFRLP